MARWPGRSSGALRATPWAWAAGDSLKLIGTNVTLKVGASAAGMDGQLVSVSGGWGDLSLRPVSLSHGSGDFDTVRMTLGQLPVSYGVMIYEQGANGLASVSLSSLPSSVPSSRISGYHTDSAGYVDLILLRDYTGDTYTYGRIEPASKTVEVPVKGKEPFTTNEETGEIRDAEGFLVNAEGNRLDTEGNVLTEKKEIPQLRFVVPGKSTVYDLPTACTLPPASVQSASLPTQIRARSTPLSTLCSLPCPTPAPPTSISWTA